MPFNGSGQYSPPGAGNFPAVAGTPIESTKYNTVINDIATGLSACVTRDGQSPATANLPMGGFKHTNVAVATLQTDYARASQVQSGTLKWLTSIAGTADVITAAAPLGFAAYAAGNEFNFIVAATNTGAVTLNINALGAKDVTKNGNNALVAGDLPINSVARLFYDGVRFQVTGVTQIRALDVDITALTADATPDQATDYLLTYDASAAVNKKALITNIQTMVKLQTITAAASASVEFVTGFDASLYSHYMVAIGGFSPSADGNLLLTISANAGAGYAAAGYRYAVNQVLDTGVSAIASSAAASSFLVAGGIESTVAANLCGTVELWTANPRILSKTSYTNTLADFVNTAGGGSNTTLLVINGIKFTVSAGNLATGTFTLYAFRK